MDDLFSTFYQVDYHTVVKKALDYLYEPRWFLGPATVSISTFVIVSILLTIRSSSRNPVGYAALVRPLSGLINYIMIMSVTLKQNKSAVEAYLSSTYSIL